ncbi:MAG: arsenosugar biosynthesis radical SAM (seleno)protein ArsS [Cyanobacteriota bacterium]|jgi:radical SAM/Cys-rich protein
MGKDVTTAPFPPLYRQELHTLQVNLGYRCNQACHHCHVGAGPWRRERMDPDTVSLIPQVLRAQQLRTLDLTGGAPELHERFRFLVQAAREMGVTVIDRCNLTILLEEGQEDLAPFLAAQRVIVVASLPCYQSDNVDRQRGQGVFARSIEGLRRLNQLGYGQDGSALELHLVYNPLGATLPPAEGPLEEAYKTALARDHGVVFNRLRVMTNMPIQRFADQLAREGALLDYKEMLRSQHAPANLERVMCRSLVSVDWRGRLYDCDFNQMLDLPSRLGLHLSDLLRPLAARAPITVADHCFGCTAGSGSSCGGALSGEGRAGETADSQSAGFRRPGDGRF